MSNASPAASSSVVPSRSDRAVLAHGEQERVTAAGEEAEERRLDGIRPEIERRDVPVEVVDRDQRHAARPRDRLGRREADEQRADESGALRDGDCVHLRQGRVGFYERLPDDRKDELEVVPRGDLGHDAPVLRVQVRLRGDDRGEHLAFLADDRRRGLVAGGLDPEDHDATSLGVASRHMIRASSRLSV